MKKVVIWLAVSAVVMFLLPWLAVTLVNGPEGMAICLFLFFAVNPIYSLIVGAYAGRDAKKLWSVPVISAVLYLAGTWVLFDMGEPAFVLYACVYLVLGVAALLISAYMKKKNL